MKLGWAMTPASMGLAALAAGDAAAFASGTCPSLFTIRTFSGDWADTTQTAQDIRVGMAVGNALALVVGLGASAVSESWWPLVLTVATVIVLDGAYEWAIRHPHGPANG